MSIDEFSCGKCPFPHYLCSMLMFDLSQFESYHVKIGKSCKGNSHEYLRFKFQNLLPLYLHWESFMGKLLSQLLLTS